MHVFVSIEDVYKMPRAHLLLKVRSQGEQQQLVATSEKCSHGSHPSPEA